MKTRVPESSLDALRAEIATLREEVGTLRREKAELELLMELTIEHSDGVAEDLFSTVEAAQREEEEQFAVVTNTVPVSIIVSRAEKDVIVYANAAAGDLLGAASGRLRGLPVSLYYEDAEERARILAAVEERGYVNNWEILGRRENGTPFWVEAFIRPLMFKAQPCLLEVYYELTAYKNAQIEILRLQRLLQNITDSMPSVLITLDLEGQVLTWNPAAEVLTGNGEEQVQGQTLWQVCPQFSRYRDLFEEVLQVRQVARRQRERVTVEGKEAYWDVDAFPLVADGVEGVVLRIDDVTRRVRLEEMMLQSAKMASVGGLAAGVAHEINNPLGAMMQSAQVVQVALDVGREGTRARLAAHGVDVEGLEQYLAERGVGEYLVGIRDMGARAAKIVSDLLSFSRRGGSEFGAYDVNALVRQTLDLAAADYDLERRYDFRELEIVWELEAGLPMVMCDGQQVQQVILNVVRNAAQAMAGERGRGGYRPRLVMRTGRREGWARLEVEDNGPGMPEEVRGRLFEPFFTTKDEGEGTGLGLWLCWSIVVERHGGRIWVESVSGDGEGGSRFVIELPLEGS